MEAAARGLAHNRHVQGSPDIFPLPLSPANVLVSHTFPQMFTPYFTIQFLQKFFW